MGRDFGTAPPSSVQAEYFAPDECDRNIGDPFKKLQVDCGSTWPFVAPEGISWGRLPCRFTPYSPSLESKTPLPLLHAILLEEWPSLLH